MKKIAILFVACLLSTLAMAQSNIYRASTYWQRLDGSADKIEWMTMSSGGADCIPLWNGTDPTATCVTLGTGLTKSGTVLNGTSVTAFNYGTPSARTLTLGTAYQASDNTKAAVITVSPQCGATLSLTTGQTCTMQARIGVSGLTCSSGTIVGTWTNGNTGSLSIGLNLTQTIGSPGDIKLPTGAYFVLCQVSGTITLNQVVDQSAG